MKIVYPENLPEKILRIEGVGGKAIQLRLSASMVVRPHEEFSLKLAVCDENGLLADKFSGELKIISHDSHLKPIIIKFEPEKMPVAEISGLELVSEGFYRFESILNGEVFYSNPVLCSSDPEKPRIYWGDPHIHTVLSNCHADRCRSYNFCYTAARYISGLDWAGAADHVSNGRCELARWKDQCAGLELFNDPPKFVALPGYEASFKGGKGGDNNFYFNKPPAMFVDDYEEGSVKTVCAKLKNMAETENFEFFAVPHHTTRPGKHGEIPDDIYPGSELMPVMEIHSKWGTSEYPGNPEALHNLHDGQSYAVDLLNHGLKLGFVGGTDTHCTLTFGYGQGFESNHIDRLAGITAVYGNELSRETVFTGMQTRNCYAAAGDRIYLDVKIAGLTPGNESTVTDNSAPREIGIVAAAPDKIKTVEIIRNGKVIKTFELDNWKGEIFWQDKEDLSELFLTSPHLGEFVYYYVRVRCANRAAAWSSPVWFRK